MLRKDACLKYFLLDVLIRNMQSQKSLRAVQVFGLVLILMSLYSLYQNLQANRNYSGQLGDIQQRLDDLDLEILKIWDQMNETLTEGAEGSVSRSPVVIRIDDVSNFAVDAQIEILELHLAYEIPVSLGIIPSFLGSDEGLLGLLDRAVQEGFEISAHGWEHENFTEFGLAEQIERLNQSRILLRELLGVEVGVFIPPHYEFNSDTILAMRETGFSIISADISRVGLGEGVLSFSAAVSYSDFSGDVWVPRSPESLILEVMDYIERFGYAVVVTHPQEFLVDGEVDLLLLSGYRDFIRRLDSIFWLTTFSELDP